MTTTTKRVGEQHSTRVPLAELVLAVAFAGALFVASSLALPTSQALADPATNDEISQLQAQIESSAQDYEQATTKAAELRDEIAKNQERIDRINEQLPLQRDRSADSARTLYMLQSEGFGILDMVLSSQNLNEFLRTVDYIDVLTQHNTLQIEKLSNLHDELEATQEQMKKDAHDADEAADRAERAMEQAKASRQAAQERAIAEAAAQLARQQEVADQVASEQKTSQDSAANGRQVDTTAASANDSASEAQGTDTQNTASSVATAEPEPEAQGTVAAEDVSWQSDRDAFISQWAGRIDNYLAGSPLAGQGATFAAAAWEYGVDPRWSPAISTVESTKGAYCFLPYNAWGWGSVSWGSWEEAIYAHVGGLARGYGATLTYESAVKYCPPNANHWYNTCLAEMNKI